MAVGLIFEFDGPGEADYTKVNEQLGIDMQSGRGAWPPGLLSHAAGMTDSGKFCVFEVWESREAQNRFMQERLGAAIARSGMTAVPTLTWVELFAYHTPAAAKV